MKNKGITFPYQTDLSGKFLRMNQEDKEELRSKIAFLITTPKGQRLYKPDFGINLDQYLFQQMDEETYNNIRNEIISVLTKFINGIKVNAIETNVDEQGHFVGVRINYSISDGIFSEQDELSLSF